MRKKPPVSTNGHPVRFVLARQFSGSAETIRDGFGRVRVFTTSERARGVISDLFMMPSECKVVGLSAAEWSEFRSTQVCVEG